jgi:hypothetical protein
MDIKINAGDTLKIPEGCKATIKDGVVVFEECNPEFKAGDVLASCLTGTLLIFERYTDCKKERFRSFYNGSKKSNTDWNINPFRFATPEEKQRLYDQMAKEGLKWDEEGEKVVNILPRAEEYKDYYEIMLWGDNCTVCRHTDIRSKYDNALYDASNYFCTKSEARKYANEFARMLKERVLG